MKDLQINLVRKIEKLMDLARMQHFWPLIAFLSVTAYLIVFLRIVCLTGRCLSDIADPVVT
jgi:hypothetical protein